MGMIGFIGTPARFGESASARPGETPDLSRDGQVDIWPPAVAEAPRSRLEQMALGVADIAMGRQAMLGLLLSATLPPPGAMRSVLRPVWVAEALQRADDMVRLVTALERTVPSASAGQQAAAAEYRIALELAAAYRGLDFVQDSASVPCSAVLRTMVRDLVEVFGPVAGSPHVRTRIECLVLPAFQRRALVLAACRLLADMLCRGEPVTVTGDVSVSLVRVTPRTARLLVAGGRGWPDDTVADLATLLACEPVGGVDADGSVVVELTFPTHDTGVMARTRLRDAARSRSDAHDSSHI